jgi:hypothetical protein
MDEALQQLYGTLQRYGGWLDRERMSVTVRADIVALGTALDACADASLLLQTLDANIARLPSGDMRKILRNTARQIRRALEEPT